ncbi:bifunctional 2-keto-4-hydroxyglutarate aldolase/2-keto-3-deoxy-6-phosphogluconate aldolase [Aquibacillus salsiterrae]|uniref:Bifunctional 2-keto-4-hydroxyglutarate aldolase/2-keto-3-deoxy-6-phosphogluconate aldolase n=1 Tax=Aquibacillus salsiterrae TaxID=2950439 RepID=A0A9X4AFU4_9BACI|nr:bifunctional 2-keto-4-hydroxyglutarate aldolase/2-keto-3-deoxy-6-phosphogluconate aldolase [Aquibacillus salsiterrae]MDC3418014.1 bifunctional 2-keto-4-hydroxyglutarate aldolase/2-keto-3-deoxy-6-phosphogluconate aldolase [Aquibacillus salsiterrae]
MQMYKYLQQVVDAKVVAVIRADSAERAIELSNACIRGGMKSIELTFTTPQAEQAIAQLAKKYPNLSIGAGTVLDQTTAKIAIQNGAQFIVSPAFDKDTALLCNLYQIPYLPGCMTVSEMKDALTYGCSIIKLFPGSIYGPQAIKQFKGPLPQLEIMPTGGVSEKNIKDWFDAGAIAVGAGGSLTTGTLDEVAEKAKQLVNAVQ